MFGVILANIPFSPSASNLLRQELRPKSLDIKQEELGDMVEKEMASTSEAIEDAVRRIEVRRSCRTGHFGAAKCPLLHAARPRSNTIPNLPLMFPDRR